jgi:hypothetical protein
VPHPRSLRAFLPPPLLTPPIPQNSAQQGVSLRALLLFLAFFAVGVGARSAFLLSKRVGSLSSVLLRARAPLRDGGRREALAAWGRTLGCPRALHDGVDMASPAAAAASAASLHAVGALERRADIGAFLQALGKGGEGVELGVQAGVFSEALLTQWPNCSVLHLVDPWRQQAQYVDVANVDNRGQERLFDETNSRMAHFGARARVHRAFSFDAVRDFRDASLDLVYVDAVHDYEGALRDFCDWWPKLAPGGVFAGHDYLDGVVPEGLFGVRSAADRFAIAVNRQLFVTAGWPETEDRTEWASFYMIK